VSYEPTAVKKARVVHFWKTGGPEVLEIDDSDVPAPKPGEVRIAVKAIGLNRSESMWRSGLYIEHPEFPARIGYEASGLIESVGNEVSNLRLGDAVSILPGFSQSKYGTYGELVLVPSAMVVKHPDFLTFEEAATIWMMFLTGYGAVIETAKLSAGEAVLIPGASSGVGLAAIQIASALGAVPIALTRTDSKRKQLLEAGAAHVVATESQDLVSEVRRITDGKGAEVVLDPVAGPNFTKLIEAMADLGRFVLYGALSIQPTTMPVLTILAKRPTIFAYQIFDTTTDRVRLEAATKFVLDGLERGAFRAVVGKAFPFEQIVEAHRYLEANDQFGKVVVTV
jgi:NADPH:quinone reductase-like Zn-dependent oxidoreductase